MGDEFKLPPGATFPAHAGDRPRRKSIDTPALKLDTSINVSVIERTDLNQAPPPPERKVESSNGQATSQTSESSKPQQNDTTVTPVMQSMFPKFDPAVRLSQQAYIPALPVPQIQVLPVSQTPPAANYSPSLYSQPQSPPPAVIAGDPWAASRMPAFQRSPRIAEDTPTNLSTADQLLDLWTIALGQDSPEALPSYTLALKCKTLRHNSESISLSSDTVELYSIHASGPTMSIHRKHPLNSSTGMTIATPTFETPTTTSPILATLFPTTAELQARETAGVIAAGHGLPTKDAAHLQLQAVQRAKKVEAGALLWDSDSSSYYFTLPLLKAQTETQTPVTALSIEYNPDESIRFLNGSSKPLLTLNLINYTLTLETRAIVDLSSSHYTLDILMSALLVLSLHLHRLDGLLTEPTIIAPHFDPPPRKAQKSSPNASKKRSSMQSNTTWLSRLNPGSRAPSRLGQLPYGSNDSTISFDKDIELGPTVVLPHHIPPMTRPPIAPEGIAPELRASNTGVDLSKFQAFDLEDPDLGKGTKAVLRLIYWGFSVIVWILGVCIGVLAAAVVALGACCGGGKGSREG